MQNKVVVLTGGGTAGHVMPNFALVPELKRRGFTIHYIGSSGMERQLVLDQKLPFHTISSGKLRRYFSVQNFLDLFKIYWGFIQSIGLLIKLRPKFVFSKGGFVSVPVCYAAALLRIPIITHESDFSPGLATKLILPFARKVFYSFPETAKYLPANKSACVGHPVREELHTGERMRGLQLCGFKEQNLPVLLVMGGSLGAQRINEVLLESLPELVKRFLIVHLAGKGKMLPFQHPNYKAFEFLGSELKDVLAATDFMLSRSGAGAVFEVIELKKPALFIPLEIGSRGDQILNAKSVVSQGLALSMSEKELTAKTLLSHIDQLVSQSDQITQKLKNYGSATAVKRVFEQFDTLQLLK